MANNEHINKVVKSTGETLIDLTNDTVTAGTLLKDVTAHDRSGAEITGTVIVAPTDVTETEDNEAFLYKSSEHDAVYDELVGGSVAWNQLIPTTGASGDQSGVTFTNNGDGSWTLNGTTTSTNVFRNLNYTANKKNFIDSHKYLMYADCADSNVGIGIVSYTGSAHYAYGKIAKIINYTEGSETASWARIQLSTSGYKVTDVITKPQVFDLTQMFGSTIADYAYNLEQSTAGSGVEWLKSYGFFTEDYYAYNEGSLVSANASGKKVVGKNLLEITANSQARNGVTFTVDKATGTVTANGTATADTYYNIPISSNIYGNVYLSGCANGGSNSTYDVFPRDNTAGARPTKWDGITTAESIYSENQYAEVKYIQNHSNLIQIRIRSGYTANNLVFKPMIRRADVTDPTFEPYTSITYPIQSTDLRGLYKLDANNKLYTDGDIYSADGQITRKYGIVDLGSLEWNKDVASNVFYTSSTELPKKTGKTNILCQKYTIVDKSYTTLSNKEITGESQTQRINIKDDDYSTSGAFKIAMSGVYLIYELATPTTETAQPFTSPQMVYRNGTEEYLDTRDAPIPVGGNRKYVDIPDWMVNQYFDDLRAEISTIAMLVMEVQRLNAEIERLRGDSNAD